MPHEEHKKKTLVWNKTSRFMRKCRGHYINYGISRPIRSTVIFSLGILRKNNDEYILILVIYWKKTGLLHTKISIPNTIYSS
jgi:hypothetical protein